MILEPLVLLTAVACSVALSLTLYEYTNFYKWRTSEAGPYVAAVLWLMLARHGITIIDQLCPHGPPMLDELLVVLWNLAALLAYLHLYRTLRRWRKMEETLDAGGADDTLSLTEEP